MQAFFCDAHFARFFALFVRTFCVKFLKQGEFYQNLNLPNFQSKTRRSWIRNLSHLFLFPIYTFRIPFSDKNKIAELQKAKNAFILQTVDCKKGKKI